MLSRSITRQSRSLTSRLQARPSSRFFQTATSSRSLRTSTRLPASTIPSRRWVSTDAEEKTLGQNEGGQAPEGSQQSSGEAARQQVAGSEDAAKTDEPAKKEIESKNREIIDLKDKYLRSVADFRNLQERTKRDVDAARSFAIQRFANDLLDSMDNFDRALTVVPEASLNAEGQSDTVQQDLKNLHSGLKMTQSILLSSLKKHGLERFDPMEEGRKFDPKVDEAVFMSPMQGKEDGDVMHTQQIGWMLNGRVLRAAKVGVVKNPS